MKGYEKQMAIWSPILKIIFYYLEQKKKKQTIFQVIEYLYLKQKNIFDKFLIKKNCFSDFLFK